MKTKYKIKYSRPNKFGIYERAVKQFGVDFEKGCIFTVGNKIYTKSDLPQYLIIHETTHIRQQAKMGVEKWWDRYFEDEKFRFSQELEAYRNQYKYITENYNDDKTINMLLKSLAKDLSGYIYGNLCSFGEAIKLIQK